jgi:HPt (histidine-containing phosphotransfer) domain-containing protein
VVGVRLAELCQVRDSAAAGSAPPSKEDPPLVDWDTLQELINSLDPPGPPAVAVVIELFRHEILGQIADVEAALAAGDRVGLARAAHRLRGGVSQLGARAFSALAAELERAAPTAAPDDQAARIAALRACHAATLHAIETRYRP